MKSARRRQVKNLKVKIANLKFSLRQKQKTLKRTQKAHAKQPFRKIKTKEYRGDGLSMSLQLLTSFSALGLMLTPRPLVAVPVAISTSAVSLIDKFAQETNAINNQQRQEANKLLTKTKKQALREIKEKTKNRAEFVTLLKSPRGKAILEKHFQANLALHELRIKKMQSRLKRLSHDLQLQKNPQHAPEKARITRVIKRGN